MDLGDATAYLRHHLAIAGRSDQLFADDGTAALIAAGDGKELVDDACAKTAVAELTRE